MVLIAAVDHYIVMNTTVNINIQTAQENERAGIINLLLAEKLPVEDLPASLTEFVVAKEDDAIIGAAGLERYKSYGLLRSMVVHPAHRNKQIAKALLQQLEQTAAASGISSVFLLTETADEYFSNKGYTTIPRDEVPAAIQQSSEFSHVCPVSVVVMRKQL